MVINVKKVCRNARMQGAASTIYEMIKIVFLTIIIFSNNSFGETSALGREVEGISAYIKRTISDEDSTKLRDPIAEKDRERYIFIEVFNNSEKGFMIYLPPIEGISFFQEGRKLVQSQIPISTEGYFYVAKPNEQIVIPVKVPIDFDSPSEIKMPITAKGFLEFFPIEPPSEGRVYKKINFKDFTFSLIN